MLVELETWSEYCQRKSSLDKGQESTVTQRNTLFRFVLLSVHKSHRRIIAFYTPSKDSGNSSFLPSFLIFSAVDMLWNADWTRSPIATLPSIVPSDGLIQGFISAVNGAITGMFVNTSECELVGSGKARRTSKRWAYRQWITGFQRWKLLYYYIRINAAASVEAIFFIYISDSIFLIIKKAKKREE